MIFIRGPYLTDLGGEVEVLAILEGRIVATRQENIIVTAYHPELSNDSTFITYFLDKVIQNLTDLENCSYLYK